MLKRGAVHVVPSDGWPRFETFFLWRIGTLVFNVVCLYICFRFQGDGSCSSGRRLPFRGCILNATAVFCCLGLLVCFYRVPVSAQPRCVIGMAYAARRDQDS